MAKVGRPAENRNAVLYVRIKPDNKDYIESISELGYSSSLAMDMIIDWFKSMKGHKALFPRKVKQ